MGFFKGLVEIFAPARYKVTNQTNVEGYIGPLFSQEFVWLEDANKEFDGWIRLGGYDTWFYYWRDGEWELVKWYYNHEKKMHRVWSIR